MDNMYDDDSEEQTGSGLRTQLEQALKTIKEQSKQLDSFKKEVQQAKLSDLLSSKGISTKVSKLIPAEVQDAEGLDAWLEEFGDVFGISDVADSAVQSVEATTSVSNVNPDTVNANRRVNTLNQNAKSPEVIQDFEARIKNASGSAEVDAIMKEAQAYFL